ncbi:MAG: molybdenum cofactor biosynthesis protein MoeB, partial [Bacteroidetes bacterium RIFCSPHIGHO2_02_FULL_44_7]
SENALQIIQNYDIIADGTDNFPTRYLVNDACVLLKKVNVFASIYRFDLQLSVFNYRNGPCYRCLFPEPPAPGTVPSCAEAGVFGVLPGVAGTLQANEIIKIITLTGEPLNGKLFTIDLLSFHPVLLTIDKDPACPVCGENPTVKKLIDYEEFCNPKNNMKEITVTELKRRLDAGEAIQLLDVREPMEYQISNIGGLLIPLSSLNKHIDKIRKDVPVVIYCRSGKRSATAVRKLNDEFGFNNTANLKGGIIAWAQEIDPTLTVY